MKQFIGIFVVCFYLIMSSVVKAQHNFNSGDIIDKSDSQSSFKSESGSKIKSDESAPAPAKEPNEKPSPQMPNDPDNPPQPTQVKNPCCPSCICPPGTN